MSAALPLWRSALFVPAIADKFIEKAHTRGADALQIDLEDSVPPERKAEARARVQAVAEQVSKGGADIIVRINRPWRLALPDLEATVGPRVTAIVCPKVPHAQHIEAVGEVLEELEAERGLPIGHTRIIALIETPGALAEMGAIARHPRIVGMTVGSEDLSLSMGMLPEPDGMYVPAMLCVAAARAAGKLPLGTLGSIAQFADRAAYREQALRAKRLGFAGASCIHPAQVEILNEVFAPSTEELTQAQRVVDAFEAARTQGLGAVALDGRMLDAPVVERARNILAAGRAIAARNSGERNRGETK